VSATFCHAAVTVVSGMPVARHAVGPGYCLRSTNLAIMPPNGSTAVSSGITPCSMCHLRVCISYTAAAVSRSRARASRPACHGYHPVFHLYASGVHAPRTPLPLSPVLYRPLIFSLCGSQFKKGPGAWLKKDMRRQLELLGERKESRDAIRYFAVLMS
jgi:hypothetical protein